MTRRPAPDGGMPLLVDIAGVPRAQPRGRHVGGRVVSTTGPATVWRRQVTQAVQAAMAAAIADGRRFPLTGAMELTIAARFPTPDAGRWGGWRTATTDRDFDNVEKLIADVLVKCGAMRDDGQVARAVYEAVWCRPTQEGVSVCVRPLKARRSAAESAGESPGWLGGMMEVAETKNAP